MNLIDNLPSKEEIERKYGKMPTEDEIGFIIHDQSSKILKIVPETWRIPLIFLSPLTHSTTVTEKCGFINYIYIDKRVLFLF